MKLDKHNQQKIDKLIKDIHGTKPLQKFLNNFINHKFSRKGKKISPQIYVVGGAVRDSLLGNITKDYDFVVEGLTKSEIADYLDDQPGTSLDIESRNFGVFKYKLPQSKIIIDIALPRQDIYLQHGRGHKDVLTKTAQKLTIEDDLSRRDFTINALAVNIGNHELVDYFRGVEDIEKKVIRCVGRPFDRLVLEDPTRIMRALRFAASLNFSIEKSTLSTIRKNHPEINKKFKQVYTAKKGPKKSRMTERVSREILALEFLKGFNADPVRYITLLDQNKIYQTLLPSDAVSIWEGMKTTKQPKNKHAEGSVWNHAMLSLENIKKLKNNKLGLSKDISINLKIATFFHDIGKVTTLNIDDQGQYTYYNHPDESVQITRQIINHLKLFSATAKNDHLHVDNKKISYLIKHHMLPSASYAGKMRDKTIVKYFLEDEELGMELLQLAYIDASSSLKEVGPQDYTALKKTIKHIELARKKLAKISRSQKIYPVDGNKIKSLLQKILNQKKQEIKSEVYDRAMTAITSNRGGRMIGQFKELILEDALENPELYKTTRKKHARASEVIRCQIMDSK